MFGIIWSPVLYGVRNMTNTLVTCAFISLFIDELKASDDNSNCGTQTIIITVLSVLLAVAVVCIAGLVILIVQLNKKHAQNKSKEKWVGEIVDYL